MTWTGTNDDVLVPFPRLPSVFVPQQYPAPAAVTPQAISWPTEMLVKFNPPDTGVGVGAGALEDVPFPNVPYSLSPQQYA